MNEWVVAAVAASIGATVSSLVALWTLRAPSLRSMRTNVDGRQVPVVLGWGVAIGALAGLLIVVAWMESRRRCGGTDLCLDPDPWLAFRIVGSMVAITFAVGWWDDRKGDERPRGFSGHLGALRGGALTGGVVKLIGGGSAGLIAMAILLGGITPLALLLAGGVTIALTANLINLLDRAPGRASKVFLLIGLPLTLLSPNWRLLAAAAVGAVLATLPLDLRAKGMLGDAGANPMGALLGLGLVLASRGSTPVLGAIVVVLLGLNLVSEKVSFSKVIEETPWLARLDHLGRR